MSVTPKIKLTIHNNQFQTYHMKDFPRIQIVYYHAKGNRRDRTVSYCYRKNQTNQTKQIKTPQPNQNRGFLDTHLTYQTGFRCSVNSDVKSTSNFCSIPFVVKTKRF